MKTVNINCLSLVRFTDFQWRTITLNVCRSYCKVVLSNDDVMLSGFVDDKLEKLVLNKNKSRLNKQHNNFLHDKLPYSEPQSWVHLTEKYQRKMYGRYGKISGTDVRICFESQLSDLHLESFRKSDNLDEMIQVLHTEKQQNKERVLQRENIVAAKLTKLEQWKKELHERKSKNKADVEAAIALKERLVEEVRRHFGFKVDPRDDRFKEMLAIKEKEQKRQLKETKRKLKDEKMLTKMLNKDYKADI